MKSNTGYTALDAAIINAIKCGSSPLYEPGVYAAAREISNVTRRDVDRVIDGRIQVLRKRGVIKFDRRQVRWVEVAK